MVGLTLDEFAEARSEPGMTVGLFITDRCPVGCAHCSVNSRNDSPKISDFELFGEIVATIARDKERKIVVITGGEPFVERRGLTLAVNTFAREGKKIVLFTSGVWAGPTVPDWIADILAQVSCVFLSTDAFHANTVNDERFVLAARAVSSRVPSLVIQVLNETAMIDRAERLLAEALGPDYRSQIEMSLITPLPFGRGAKLFNQLPQRKGRTYGVCDLVNSPLIRYDGVATACCNEQVIMGFGPSRLRSRFTNSAELNVGLQNLREDPLLAAIGTVGFGQVTNHPRFAALAEEDFPGMCQLCWRSQKLEKPLGTVSDPLLSAMTLIARGR